MSNPLIVGVDVHRKANTACFMDSQGRELVPRFNFDNNRPGTETFVQHLTNLARTGSFDAIQIATEAANWFWFLFLHALSQHPALQERPLSLYPLNPRLTANFKKTYSDLDHTDLNDAFVAADRLRLGRDLPTPFRSDDTYLPIRFLTRYRYRLVHNLAREKAYCLSILYLKASEYTRKHGDKPYQENRPFSDPFGTTSRAVIQTFSSVEEIAALPFDDLVEFIDQHGKRRFADPGQTARKLLQVARNSYHLPEPLQEPVQIILNLSLQHIASLERQLKRVGAAIEQLIAPVPHTLDTIPGFGPVFSAGIISELGDLSHFHGCVEAQVAKLAGFHWPRRQSADFEAEDTRITRHRNRYLRYYFCQAANSVRMRDADYAAFYQRKYNEVRKHQHKRAIVLTARKLVRLVVRLLTTNQTYRPRRL
jgi:transposase